jgi:hypothetical protein
VLYKFVWWGGGWVPLHYVVTPTSCWVAVGSVTIKISVSSLKKKGKKVGSGEKKKWEFLTFCVIALGLLSLKENNSCLHKLEFIAVILSIIAFLRYLI